MVVQGNAQVFAHVGQFRGPQVPQAPGKFHGAQEFGAGRLDVSVPAAGIQHRPVEGGVVRRYEIDAFEEGHDFRPQHLEVRLVPDVLPGYAVKVGKHEIPPRRPHQGASFVNNFSRLNDNHRQGAGAVASVVRGFEIDRGEAVKKYVRRFLRRFGVPERFRGA